MRSSRRWQVLFAGGFGWALTALTGCQTWVPEICQTLPSPHYMDHLPQYTPPSPTYPLPNELEGITRANARAAQFAPVGGPPPGFAPGGGGVLPPPPVGPGPMPPVPPGPGMPGVP
jgi:hypothetical protein